MPIPFAAIGAGLGLGSDLLGTYLQYKASQDASRQAAEGQRQALEYSKQIYGDTSRNMQPYLQAGQGGLARQEALTQGMQQPGFDYQQPEFSFDANQDPGAKFMMERAAQALNASSLAKGGMGGGAIKALNTEMQNMGQTAYQGAFQRHMDTSKMKYGQAADKYGRAREFQTGQIGANRDLAQGGREAAGTLGNLGQGQAQYGGGIMAGMGATRAAGTLGGYNALGQGIQNGMGRLTDYIGTLAAPKNTGWQ